MQRSHRKHSPAISATTIPEIEKVPSQRLLSLHSLWSLRSLESGFYMIAMIAAIAEVFFLSDRSDHMENRLKRQKYHYYTYRRSFFGPKMHVIPLRVGCQWSEILVSLFSLLSSGWKTKRGIKQCLGGLKYSQNAKKNKKSLKVSIKPIFNAHFISLVSKKYFSYNVL